LKIESPCRLRIARHMISLPRLDFPRRDARID
jgi:hypothetical protein